jgi:hypothetical protein
VTQMPHTFVAITVAEMMTLLARTLVPAPRE